MLPTVMEPEAVVRLPVTMLSAPMLMTPAMVPVIAPVIRLESPALMAAESILVRLQVTVSRA
jgi:hypothetical protein